ncbi:MAG: TonB-dependent receptor [Bacteroidales bacterium]|nr:TonB-dependent receptor [Bacteroidales bacterium]
MFRERRVYSFRQWTRKPFATFNSLKLLCKISVLCTAYNLANPVQKCSAQTDSLDLNMKVNLGEVVVSGQRTTTVYSQIARNITVITESNVKKAPELSVNELLENVPLVDIRQRGTNGVQADISIQGGSFDQTLVLLNGINLSDPQTGHYNLNLPIDIESVDRIEVLKGPASRVFGTNAFCGAVNFVTCDSPDGYIKASMLGGMFGLYRGSLSVNRKSGILNNFASVSKTGSDGYISGTGYNTINGYYSGKIVLNNNNIHYQIGLTKKDYGANSFYSAKYANQYESTRTYLASIGASLGSKLKIVPNLFWRKNYDHYILIRLNPEAYQNFHFTDVYGASINTNIKTVAGKFSIGAEYRKEIIYSTTLGKQLDSTEFLEVHSDPGIYYTKKDWRENASIFIEHNLTIGNWYSTLGIMANANSKLDEAEFYPGIDLSYKLNRNFKLFGSVNRSLRLPTFTDLYYNGPQNIGNAGLKPEKARTYESGVKYNKNGVDATFSFFHRKADNVIDWIWQDSFQKWKTENITSLATDGFELSLSLTDKLFKSVLPFIEDVRFSYSYTTIQKYSNNAISYYALDNLKHKITLDLTHNIIPKLAIVWKASFQDRNGGYLKWNSDSQIFDKEETVYRPFFLLDAKLLYTKNDFKMFIDFSNILNSDYMDFGNIPQPGIWVKAGIELKFDI